jgi:branched-chain amino acid transport system substrate-binding protein
MRSSRSLSRALVAMAAAVLVAGLLTACGSSSNSSNSSKNASSGGGASKGGGTIAVGNISAVTGPIPLGDASQGAKAYFDALNAKGGINGTKVKFVIGDDKTDPALSARVARDQIQQEKVVAFVGDLTLVGCGVNHQVLQRFDVRSVMAGGADPACFTQPNISPINTGPTSDYKITALYAAQKLGAKRVCSLFTNTPTLNPTHKEIVQYFEQQTGQKMAFVDETLGQNSNLPALFASAKKNGCDAILTDGTPSQTGPMVKARNQQGMSNVPLIFQGAQYNEALAKALGNVKGVYSIAELTPFTEDSPALSQMKADMAKSGVGLNGLSQFGWFSAKVFSDVAATIKGPITRDSVNKALLGLSSFDTAGWTATPYAFGSAKSHNANRGGKMVKIESGKWVVATPDWIVLK